MDKNIIQSSITGFVVGDALGVPIQFLPREQLQKNPLKEMIGYGSHKVPEGTWSDDSSMLLATMDSISEKKGINYEDIMQKFVNWYDNAEYTSTDVVFDFGVTTQQSIYKYKQGNAAIYCGMSDFYSNGNGSLMRILPITLYNNVKEKSEIEKLKSINNVSSLTHSHEISCLGCKIFSDYVDALIDKKDKFKALEEISNINYSDYYSNNSIELYKNILNKKIVNFEDKDIKSSGFVVDTLEASIWCTLTSNSYEEAVIKAINLGNDTDTIGAITGALNGIIYGYENIPTRWIEKIKNKELLEEIIENFSNTLNYERDNIR